MKQLLLLLLVACVFAQEPQPLPGSVQDGLANLNDCTHSFLTGLNDDLKDQWNCFNNSNLVFAGDIPGFKWDPRAYPYLQREMKEALHTVMTDLLYNSNLVNFTVRLPEFYVFKGYETLAGAMGTQYEFGHGKCNVSATTVAHPDDPTLKYQFVKPFPTFPYRVGDKIVIEKITGSLGNGMANRILQRMLTAYGIPYTKANANNPKISVRETNVISGTHQTIKYYRYERPNGDTTLPFQWCEKVIGIETTGLSLTNYAYPRPVISQTMNIQAFKYLYNVNNPNDLIANASNNVLDADVQNKLLLKTPYTGYTLTSCTAVNPCSDKQPIDLIIALDGSSAISAEEFVAELKMASDVIEQLPVGRGTIRVGFVMYSSNTTSFELYEYASVEEAKGKIKGMKKPNGKNDIKKGFDAVKNILSNSAAVRGKGVPKVLVLVTASHPDDDDASIYAAVDSVHELGVNIAVIGVHTVNGYTDENLEYFATDPVTRNVFKVGTFEMSDIIRKLVTETCKLPAKVNQEPVLPTSVFAGTTVNLEYVTSNQTYDLVLQGNGAVLIRMYYFPDERIPTTYDYDLFEYCVENCVIPIPAISMDFMTPIVRRDGDEMVVPEGKRVVVSVEYLGTPARSDTPQDFTFTVAPHDSSKIKLQPTAQPFSPASADELAEGDAAFEEDFGNHETDEVEVPVIGSTGVFVVIAAACGALLLAGAVVAVFMLRRKVEQTTTDAPAPRLDTIVTTPEVESEAIKTDSKSFAVKRLNSSRVLNELAN